ncbi:MAG: DUF4364 family protein [Fastidiosipila sp.]|nr:DUF4364 family protein [Fastidiosipila sp.]
MDSKDITREKLVLLYILQEAPGLRRSDLIETALGTLTADYFILAEALNWLESSEFIALMDTDLMTEPNNDNGVAECYLTVEGERIVSALKDQLPESIQLWIADHLDQTSLDRKKRKTIEADYKPTDKGTYLLLVRHLSDQGDAFSVELELPTEEMARKAAFSFRRDPENFYSIMLQTLLKNN